MDVNKIYNEDCLVTMKSMPDSFCDFVVSSPPYNFADTNCGRKRPKKYVDYDDELTQDEYFEWQKKVIQELLRVTKNEIFYNIQLLSGNKSALFKLIGHFADNLKEVLIWDKGFGEPAMQPGVMNSVFEFILVFAKNKAEQRRFNEEWRGTVDNIIRIKKNFNTTGIEHAAIMPLKLARYLIRTFTKENDIVLDPFAGTGTTCISAFLEKRRWIGIELSPIYFEAAQNRMNPYLTQYSLFDIPGY